MKRRREKKYKFKKIQNVQRWNFIGYLGISVTKKLKKIKGILAHSNSRHVATVHTWMCTYINLFKQVPVCTLIYYIPKGNIKVVCNMHMNVIPEGI